MHMGALKGLGEGKGGRKTDNLLDAKSSLPSCKGVSVDSF